MSFILAFFFSVAVWAAPEACSTVELDQDVDGLGSIPRWSQGESNLCYAYTAANLIDAYRFRHGDKNTDHVTSPLLLGVQTIESHLNRGSSFRSGRVEHAFATARNIGTCNAKIVSDRLGPYKADEVVSTLTRYYKESLASSDAKILSAMKVHKFLKVSGLKDEELPATSELEKNLNLGQEEFISRTLSSFCSEAKKIDYLPVQKTLFQPKRSLAEITERLNSLLDSRNPVGINFCSTVVTERDHKGRFEGNKWKCNKNLNHSALIAGRKIIDGKCHYLVRDTACDNYRKTDPRLCENGQFWLEVDQLIANLEGIYWLE